MKLKVVSSICQRNRRLVLYDRTDDRGELSDQWLGDGAAAYPLYGAPIMDPAELCTVLDIPEKKVEKMLISRLPIPAIDLDDVADWEVAIEKPKLSIYHGGRVLLPLETTRGVLFIQAAYLDPLKDMADTLQLWERRTADGRPYIAAKAGLMIFGVIFPVDAVNEDLVDCLEKLLNQCRVALIEKQEAERAALEAALDQSTLFGKEGSGT